jgi:filamentous hemagglutinin family protein
MLRLFRYFSLIYLGFALVIDSVSAQIASDGSLSIPTTVGTNNNLDFNITNGTQVGSNLYHSFQELSVPTGGSVVFQNNSSIVNIFSRVTGPNLSNIDGLIQSSGNASLFLFNPNDITKYLAILKDYNFCCRCNK